MEVLLIIILSIWLLGRLWRWWFRRWLRRSMPNQEPRRPQRREGEVHVEQTVCTEKKVSKTVGDYVEYEEIVAEHEEIKR